MDSATFKILHKIYTTPRNPGSFGGPKRLYEAARRQGYEISLDHVNEYLSKSLPYSLNKTARKKFPRNKTTAFYIDEVWQMDLIEMPNMAESNEGTRYILVAIDVFSKYAFAKTLINKSGPVVMEALKNMLRESGRKPSKIHTDMGKEFLYGPLQEYLASIGVQFFTTFSETKAAVVERFNKTLKSRIHKFFTHTNSDNYTESLADFIHSYNHTPHSSIGGATPADVTPETQLKIWKKHHKLPPLPRDFKFKFNVGDAVRISRDKGPFGKGYRNTFSEEYFHVKQRLMRQPPVYRLEDLEGDEILGVFYEPQLMKIVPPEYHVLEKVVQKRGNQYLVKWRGFPDKFNSWVHGDGVVILSNSDNRRKKMI